MSRYIDLIDRKMCVFICHTPLHVLISSVIASAELLGDAITFIVIEDSDRLFEFAVEIGLEEVGSVVRLAGSGVIRNKIKYTIAQRRNVSLIRKRYSGLAKRVYVFNDLRPEAQVFLNDRRLAKSGCEFVLVEDGMALYPPAGKLVDGLLAVAKRKVFFGWRWQHASFIGLHPSLSEVRSFYPSLLRKDLCHLKSRELPVQVLRCVSSNSRVVITNNTGNSRYSTQSPSAIIAIPFGFQRVEECRLFLSKSLELCKFLGFKPYLKPHPRDKDYLVSFKDLLCGFDVLSQSYPLEVLVGLLPDVRAIIGCRTSSLYICRLLYSDVGVYFCSNPSRLDDNYWVDFYRQVGVEVF